MKTKLSQDTSDFLETLLWVAYSPDQPETRHIQNWTIHEFHPEFVAAVDSFLSGFRSFLFDKRESMDEDGAELLDEDAPSRSFGGNVFFSLSGHGVGFWDDHDSERGEALQAALVEFAGDDKYRFHELESSLAKFKGRIHLAFRTAAFRREYLAKYFATPATVTP